MEFNWNNIRTYNNSQNNAFEELVCQLAREEEIKDKKSFYRIAAPDGGVEAYCILENGDEYGWQAKYFFSMNNSQWQQLDKSFKTAFEKHPKLVKYYICLPLDRQDPRIPDQLWFMDKWNLKLNDWTKYALSNDRNIEFEYWGSHEILHRLSEEKHAGRRYFWFNQQEFLDQWFAEKLERSIDDLGDRYTPELNFELEIAKIFNGIARDDKFKEQFNVVYGYFLRNGYKAINSFRDEKLTERRNELKRVIYHVEIQYSQIDFLEIAKIDYDSLINSFRSLESIIETCEKDIEELKKEIVTDAKQNLKVRTNDKFDYEIRNLRDFSNSIYELINFCTSVTASLSNLPLLILKGEAGVGKSHLIADIAKKRLERNQFSLLLLGQHFVSEENPWTQILRNLIRINCDETCFLQALNAKAQAVGYRLIIFIDAINEGRGRYFWKKYIKSFIKSFEKYKWLGLVISVRSSYEKLLAPDDLISNDIAVRLTHFGFANVEYEASKLFFRNYNIEQPSIPLLHPEFQNPLFLKLFCEGLKKAGLTSVPEGYEGITTIINFYLNGINKRLSEPDRLNFPDSINLVKKAIELIIQENIENGQRYLTYEDAFSLVEYELLKYSNQRRFLDELISEGIITKNLFWESDDQYIEGIYITYERFEDHFATSLLLEKYLDKNAPENSFLEGNPLFEYIGNENKCYINKGIVEALSIQLPELIGKELYEVAPHCKKYYPVIESFIESLIWRKTTTFSNKLIEYINECVIGYKGTHDKFLDILLLISSNPKNYFNADFLHNHLMKFSLPNRDAWWTTYIHYQFYEQTPVKRLIDWAWSDEDKSHISDESIRLASMTISWFLTSSNRYLRDSATKALISLMEKRIPILIQILKDFKKVNDPYVYERLFAVAYGCTLRTEDTINLRTLCEYIYEKIFKKEYVYPHILLRDYARNTIEYSLYIGLDIKIDLNRIRPPYKSKWPKNIPSNDDIKKYEFDYKSEDFKKYYWSQNEIIQSMQTEYSKIHNMYGDFGRYIFQRSFGNWRDLNPHSLSNLAVKRIIDLGYDVKKHGEFDRNINRHFCYGRSGRKPERIGKKYQWIAFYELLAKVSDNFTMYDEAYWGENKPLKYDGPWKPYIRDIDPSILIKKTGKEIYEKHSRHWWLNVDYDNWEILDEDWVRISDDLPNPADIIFVNDDSGVEWIVLEIYPHWSEPPKIGQEKYDHPHKDLWYQIRSYLVSQKEYKDWIKWISQQNFYGRWMPESVDRYEIFSREYYWSPAFNFFKKPYYSGEVWRKVYDRIRKNKIGQVMVTTESYLWEEEYDCSKEETISYFKPSKVIFNGMKLNYSPQEGHFLNQKGDLVCFDPSVNNKSISCLLVHKNEFLKFLKQEGLNIFWSLIGEKIIVGGKIDSDDYLDRLEFSGPYYMSKKNKIFGQINSNFK